ncbi:MAG: lamin tail domain-containing protein [Candidatus Lambdaproteobacteria bacterium]|nr:lamin tail domain-containing protein [Candidatus Lambdaproteobacteria bacterium]
MLLLLLSLLAGGCLEDADKKSYKYNNPLDPYSTATASGVVEIAAVVSPDMVLLVNLSGSQIALTGWTLTAQPSGTAFTIGTFSLANPGFVRIWSATGTDDVDDLYGSGLDWGSASNQAILKDDEGFTIDECLNPTLSSSTTCWNP